MSTSNSLVQLLVELLLNVSYEQHLGIHVVEVLLVDTISAKEFMVVLLTEFKGFNRGCSEVLDQFDDSRAFVVPDKLVLLHLPRHYEAFFY